MMRIKVSDYVIKCLEKTGTEHVFMLPGGGAMHLDDSLGKSEILTYVACLHEQACAIAAEAYARVNNRVGLVMVTTGPGGTNALTGVAGAYLESTPMLVISGQVKRVDRINGQGVRQQGMQELDTVSLASPITKYAAVVEEPLLIRYHLERALYEAQSGRKGPVWLDIPLDVQATEVEEDALIGYTPLPVPKNTTLLRQAGLVIELLNRAERPVLLAGGGICLSGARAMFKELKELLGIPVLTTWNGIDLLPEDDPLYYGRPGGLGQRYANLIQQNADFLLCIGARMNLLQTGFCHEGFARGATQIMVDIDPAELHKANVHPTLAIAADAGAFMEALLACKAALRSSDRQAWLSYAARVREKYPLVRGEYWQETGHVNTYCLLETISDEMRADDIYVSGSSGSCIDISMQTFRVKKGQRVFATKGLAAMGFGLPAAIGACLAGGGRRTVSVCGDGGFMMNIQELETLRRLALPVKIFVLCNTGYGAIAATQRGVFEGHYVACNAASHLTLPDIARVAAAFGLQTRTISENSELKEGVAAALAADGPVIVAVKTPLTLTATPKQISYKRADGQMASLPLEYMSPPIEEAELRESMLIPPFERK